jgi:uroporphyrinogen decarboxylase-like protein
MTSKERILAAFRRNDVDYLPCSIYFNPNLTVPGYDLARAEGRLRLALDLGTDPVLDTGLSVEPHPDVTTRTWVEDGDPPLLYREYVTPVGTLRHGVRYTPEWPHGEHIPWNDSSAGHTVEPLIKLPDDIAALRYVHHAPDRANLARARTRIDAAIALGAEMGVPVRATCGHGIATLLFVMGAQNMVLFAADHPDAFEELAQIEHMVTLARIRLLAEAGVDMLKRFGGYEQTNFLSPAIFEAVVAPLLRIEVIGAHEAGVPIYYRVVTGMKPLLSMIGDIGFDCVEGFEPVLSECSNADLRDAFAGRACIWTGVSSPGHLGLPDDTAARQAVRDAVDTFGRRGFILGVTNSIRAHWPWRNTLSMIDEWKKLR